MELLFTEETLSKGGYYLHLEPDNSFLGVGFWAPNAKDLFRIRKELEIDAAELETLISDPTFKNYWAELSGDEVKTAPKGFSKEHPNIDLIKKEAVCFVKKFSNKEVLASDFLTVVDKYFINIRPFLTI